MWRACGNVEGRWKTGLTESKKTVHLSSIFWASALCQALCWVLKTPIGVSATDTRTFKDPQKRDRHKPALAVLCHSVHEHKRWRMIREDGKESALVYQKGTENFKEKWILVSKKLNRSLTKAVRGILGREYSTYKRHVKNLCVWVSRCKWGWWRISARWNTNTWGVTWSDLVRNVNQYLGRRRWNPDLESMVREA